MPPVKTSWVPRTTYIGLDNLSQAALASSDHTAAKRHLLEGIELSTQTGDLSLVRSAGVPLGLGAEDAELVALRVGQHDPAGARAVLVAQVGDDRGAVVDEAGQLLVAG